MADEGNALRKHLIARMRRLPDTLLVRAAKMMDMLEAAEIKPLRPQGVEGQKSGEKSPHSKNWPHAPLHRLSDCGTFIVTAGTLHKKRLFADAQRLDLLEDALLTFAKQYGWQLEAWAVFSNHYHFVGHACQNSADLQAFIKHLHADTARRLNRLDAAVGRQVWHNYLDTRLTFEKSYLARLKYVHQNPVKHGLVSVANQYRWCSASWFERTATLAQVKTIYSFKIDKIHVSDDFD